LVIAVLLKSYVLSVWCLLLWGVTTGQERAMLLSHQAMSCCLEYFVLLLKSPVCLVCLVFTVVGCGHWARAGHAFRAPGRDRIPQLQHCRYGLNKRAA
jgi:hypothetical protein